MDPRLSADGADEALRLMFGGDLPGWGTFSPENANTLRIRAADTGDSWFVTLGRFTGTDPDSQTTYDEAGIHVAGHDPGGTAAASVIGSAADLDCWLWQRPPLARIDRSGDQQTLSRFDSVIAPGIT